jgi:hypothetical protein
MSNTKYYLALSVFSLAIGIYNLSASSEGKTMTCYSLVEMDYETYLQYNKTLANNNAGTTTGLRFIQGDPTPTYELYIVKVTSSNIYSSLNMLIAIGYMVILVLSLYLTVVISYMANQLPEDFINVGKWKRFFSCFCKIFPIMIILLHWLLLVLILALWMMVLTKTCKTSESTTQLGVTAGMYYNNVLVLNIVNTAIWILLHYGGATLREILYQEPFMYMPYVGSKNACCVILLRKLGP